METILEGNCFGSPEGSCFAVHETPCCVWDVDLKQRNREFIEGLQPDYFSYLADVHTPEIDGPRRQLASAALRAAYGQGLETLFAVLFASLQAPDCVVGWLPRYRQEDLHQLVAAIDHRKILTKIPLGSPTWEGVVDAIHRHVSLADKDAYAAMKGRVARLWRWFAKDFVDPVGSDEYNTIKHGFRGKPGGFHMRIGPTQQADGPSTDDQVHDLGGSEFGTSFFAPESIGPKYHFKLRRVARNWCPETLVHGLHSISRSLQNLVAFLRFVNRIGDPSSIFFGWPQDPELFEQAWKTTSGAKMVNFGLCIRQEDIEVLSKDQILAVYAPPGLDTPSPDTSTPQAPQT